MYLEVYPDIIFIINFLLDFIILSILKVINRKDSRIGRRLAAAAAGALFAAIAGIFPWMNIMLRFFIMNIGAAVIMLPVAFGRMKKKEMIKQGISLYLITYFLGGLINSVYYHTNLRLYLIQLGNVVLSNIPFLFVFISVLLLIPVLLLLYRLYLWYRSSTLELAEVEIQLKDQSIRTKGLIDSGNCLYEPVFGKPVIVMEDQLLSGLLTPELCKELDHMKSYIEGKDTVPAAYPVLIEEYGITLKFIPYRSVGKEQGIMIGLVLDKILINQGKETICNRNITAAICDNRLSGTEEYHVILHKELIV